MRTDLVAASIQGAEHVTATDFEVQLLQLTANNASLNQLRGQLTTSVLDWRRPQDFESDTDTDKQRPYDVIIAADIVYAQSMFEPLLSTLVFLTEEGGPATGAEIFMAHQKHNQIQEEFFEMLQKAQFQVEVLKESILSMDSLDADQFCFDSAYGEKETLTVSIMRLSRVEGVPQE